ELARDEPRMVRQLHDLDQQVVHGLARDDETEILERLPVAVVEFVAVPMPLAYHVLAVQLARERSAAQAAFLRAEAHRAAEVGRLVAALDLAAAGGPFGDQRDDRMHAVAVVLAGIGAVQPGHVARELDHRGMHAVADPEVRDAMLARVARRGDLALEAALAEATGNEDAIDVAEKFRPTAFDLLGLHPAQVRPRALLQATVAQRFAERLVRILVFDVLADDRDRDLALRVLDRLHRPLPLGEV